MEEIKKILFVHWQSEVIGGAEVALLDLISILESTYEIDNLFHKKGPVTDYYCRAGINLTIRSIHTKRRKYPGLHTIQSYFLAKYLRSKKYNYVICNTLSATSRVKTACRKSKIPLITFIRDHFSYSPMNYKLLHSPIRLIAVSKDIKEHVLNFEPKLDVHVVYDYIAFEPFQREDDKMPITNREDSVFTIGIVSRIQSIKQHHILINSVKRLSDEGQRIELLIFGKPGPSTDDQNYYSMIKRLVDDLGLNNCVHFKGFSKDIRHEINKLDTLAVVSKNEAFPRVVLEAQLCKVPVIGAKTGGIPEQIDHLKTGILVDLKGSDPVAELANAILMLYNNKELREQIAINAYHYCKDHYASKEYTINCFNKAIASWK